MTATLRQRRALRALRARAARMNPRRHWAWPHIRDAILAVLVSTLFGVAAGLYVRSMP